MSLHNGMTAEVEDWETFAKATDATPTAYSAATGHPLKITEEWHRAVYDRTTASMAPKVLMRRWLRPSMEERRLGGGKLAAGTAPVFAGETSFHGQTEDGESGSSPPSLSKKSAIERERDYAAARARIFGKAADDEDDGDDRRAVSADDSIDTALYVEEIVTPSAFEKVNHKMTIPTTTMKLEEKPNDSRERLVTLAEI